MKGLTGSHRQQQAVIVGKTVLPKYSKQGIWRVIGNYPPLNAGRTVLPTPFRWLNSNYPRNIDQLNRLLKEPWLLKEARW